MKNLKKEAKASMKISKKNAKAKVKDAKECLNCGGKVSSKKK